MAASNVVAPDFSQALNTGGGQESATDAGEADTRTATQKAFDNYNIIAAETGLPKARFLTKAREQKLRARLRDVGLEGWNEALRNLAAATWMHGNNDRGWAAHFDFLLQEASLLKLIEGAYNRE